MMMLDCIDDMRKEYEAGCGLPITDDSQSLQRFSSKLEHLLLIGLRGRVTQHRIDCVICYMKSVCL